ncbi:MAG: hypothetical protein HEEMFOPI_00747 [Holosporales bacterium]
MKIEQSHLFKAEEPKKTEIPINSVKKEAFFNPFNIHLAMGNNPHVMRDEGIAILRILGSRFSKNVTSGKDPHINAQSLLTVLSHEMKIKKGALPLELSVMDTLYNLFIPKQ